MRDFVKDHLETIMKEEMKNFFEVEHPELEQVKKDFTPARSTPSMVTSRIFRFLGVIPDPPNHLLH